MFSYRRVRFNVGYGERHFLIHPTLRVCVGYREESEPQHKSNTCFSLHQQLGLAFVKQWHKKTQQTSCDQQQDRHLLWRWSQTCPRGQGQYRSASSLRHPEFPAQTWVMSVETGRHTHRRMKETEHTLSLGKLSSSPMLSSACKKASSGPWWPVLEVSKEWNDFFSHFEMPNFNFHNSALSFCHHFTTDSPLLSSFELFTTSKTIDNNIHFLSSNQFPPCQDH